MLRNWRTASASLGLAPFEEALSLTGLYVGVQTVSVRSHAFRFKVEAKQFFDDSPGQDSCGFIEAVISKQKCLLNIAKYETSLEPIFDKGNFLSKCGFGNPVLTFYL